MKSSLGINFGFYKINRSYIEDLKRIDSHVPDCDYQDYGRAEKFYVGPFVDDFSHVTYFAPVSSQFGKNLMTSRNPPEHHGVKFNIINKDKPDGKNEVKGCVDFRFAIPCEDPRLFKEYIPDKKSNQSVLLKHLASIKSDLDCVSRHTFANMQDEESYPTLKKESCNHDLLEDKMWEYIDTLDDMKQSMISKARSREVFEFNENNERELLLV